MRLGFRRSLQLAVLAVPVVLFAAAGWSRRWTVDDGFIYMRVVQQIHAGNGPVFNAGERVEAFTSPLWLALLWFGSLLLPLRLEWLAVVLGIGLSASGLLLVILGARLLARRSDPNAFLVPFGALVPVALLPAWVFQTSGLESGLVLAWLGACLFILARWASADESMSVWDAATIGLGWLVRPELALYSITFLVVVISMQWSRDTWPRRLRFLASATCLPLAYQVFRMGFYGSLVANSAIAKDAWSQNWERGWEYLVDFVVPYLLWLPAAAIVAGGLVPLATQLRRAGASRSLAVIGMLVAGALLNGLYVVSVGGDWIHARLLLPALFAFVAPVAVVPLARRYVAGVVLIPWAFIFGLVLRPPHAEASYSPLEHTFTLANSASGHVTYEDYGWGAGSPRRAWYRGDRALYVSQSWTVFGRFKRIEIAATGPRARLPAAVVSGVGLVSYAIGPELYVLDTLGLADAVTARLISTPGPLERKPGHEKPLPPVWVAALFTAEGSRLSEEDFPPEFSPLIPATTGLAFQVQVAWARAALRCPAIRELREATEAPLGVRRFVRNVLGSLGRTRLRIPPDPEQAYRKHCGPGIPAEVQALASPSASLPRVLTRASSSPPSTSAAASSSPARWLRG